MTESNTIDITDTTDLEELELEHPDAPSQEFAAGFDLSAPADTEAGNRFQAALSARRESQRPSATRERTATLGGPRMKMSVIGEIPGYHMYWENDDEGAIEQLLYEGFEFVQPAEVGMASHIVADADTAARVSRYVGVKADKSPMRAYLLKIPDEIWAERQAARNLQADEWDNAIRNAQVEPDTGRYLPKGATISLDTKFRKEL